MKLLEDAKNLLFTRQRSYKAVFEGPAGDKVLEDLAKFCRADESTFHMDPRIAASLDGRREVWLRIQQHVGLSSEALLKIYERK